MAFIVFNNLKRAERYVARQNKTVDKALTREGYDWEVHDTYIDGNLVYIYHGGDGCGCGCDNYIYHNTYVIGRIKNL